MSLAIRRFSVTTARRGAGRLLRQTTTLVLADPTHPDRELLITCRAYSKVVRELDQLFLGRHSIRNEAERSCRHTTLDERAYPLLQRITDLKAKTLDGHAARAAALVAWDSGHLIGQARSSVMPEERLMAALVIDLVCQD